MIQSTSLQAYFGEVVSTLGRRQRMVLEVFASYEDLTNQELSEKLHWPINTVTPRVYELRAMDLLEEKCRRTDQSTGRTAIAWRLKIPHQQLNIL